VHALQEVLGILREAGNVVATVAGHTHQVGQGWCCVRDGGRGLLCMRHMHAQDSQMVPSRGGGRGLSHMR
jgi:hypothetical protein